MDVNESQEREVSPLICRESKLTCSSEYKRNFRHLANTLVKCFHQTTPRLAASET